MKIQSFVFTLIQQTNINLYIKQPKFLISLTQNCFTQADTIFLSYLKQILSCEHVLQNPKLTCRTKNLPAFILLQTID